MASEPIIIALMGLTGSGMSNFINKLTGMREEKAAGGLKPHTRVIREFTVNLPSHRYVFVDTPGFDETDTSGRDVLRMITEWLERRYRGNIKLTGIIYTHRITDKRMTGSVCENSRMFSRLCGARAAERVRLVTTMWDRVKDEGLAENRVSQLEKNFWKSLIDAGARHRRFERNSSRCAWEIVQDLVGEDLLPQEELANAEQLAVKAELQKTSDEIDKAKVSFFRRMALPFFKRTQAVNVHSARSN